MNLLNSKRVLYADSHVTTKLTEEEQRDFSVGGAGAVGEVHRSG